MLGFIVLFNFCFTLALSFLNRKYKLYKLISSLLTSRGYVMITYIAVAIGKPQAVIPEEGYKGRTKERIEQGSSKG